MHSRLQASFFRAAARRVGSTRKVKRAAAAILCLVGTVALLVLVQPFARRYEGKTARQWIHFYTAARRLPERAVVAHFGGGAIPLLLEESRPSGLFWVALRLERVAKLRLFEEWQVEDFNRRLACNDWARILLEADREAYVRAMTNALTASEGISLTALFFGDRQLGPTLKAYSNQSTNLAARSKAEDLLEAYRNGTI